VTFGTLFNGDLGLFRMALDALAELPVHLVMTVGLDQDPSELGALPANVRVERFIAQADLLPSCSVVVHHGGAGTTFGALAHGVPQVILPQGADNYEHAAMCEGAGVSLTLNPDALNNSSLASAVQQVLLDPLCCRQRSLCRADRQNARRRNHICGTARMGQRPQSQRGNSLRVT
jgi:MGT family glycosyltransferase